ncbi:MAG: hypothetical protein AAB443_04185 [Patescibacteria group bacterium]
MITVNSDLEPKKIIKPRKKGPVIKAPEIKRLHESPELPQVKKVVLLSIPIALLLFLLSSYTPKIKQRLYGITQPTQPFKNNSQIKPQPEVKQTTTQPPQPTPQTSSVKKLQSITEQELNELINKRLQEQDPNNKTTATVKIETDKISYTITDASNISGTIFLGLAQNKKVLEVKSYDFSKLPQTNKDTTDKFAALLGASISLILDQAKNGEIVELKILDKKIEIVYI